MTYLVQVDYPFAAPKQGFYSFRVSRPGIAVDRAVSLYLKERSLTPRAVKKASLRITLSVANELPA